MLKGENHMKIRAKLSQHGAPCELRLAGGSIAAVSAPAQSGDFDLGGDDWQAAPGLLDLQLNGYGGTDFNDANTSVEQIAGVVRPLWRTGVTAFCPTVITGSEPHITQCIRNLVGAADQAPAFARAMKGIHVEGPFISPEDGPRGAHPRAHVRPPDWDEFRRWQDAAGGRIRLLTLSPEWPGSPAFIARVVQSGVRVAIGHTAATPAQLHDAVRAGATLSTHLGNGSHAKLDRHPNYIWEQLAADALWASFIVDGHHLPPAVVKCMLRAKTLRRSILVTDAIAAAGQPPGPYRLGAVAVEVRPDRRVCLPGTPYLAGSVLELHDAIANTVRYAGIALDDALQLATANPATFLFGDAPTLDAGQPADLILFRWEPAACTLRIAAVIVNGTVAHSAL
jgi:N-acetylglucosamine-6-phosphate deacetylase